MKQELSKLWQSHSPPAWQSVRVPRPQQQRSKKRVLFCFRLLSPLARHCYTGRTKFYQRRYIGTYFMTIMIQIFFRCMLMTLLPPTDPESFADIGPGIWESIGYKVQDSLPLYVPRLASPSWINQACGHNLELNHNKGCVSTPLGSRSSPAIETQSCSCRATRGHVGAQAQAG